MSEDMIEEYPTWEPPVSKPRTRLLRDFAERLVGLHERLSYFAETLGDDSPLWDLLDAYHDVLDPCVAAPCESTSTGWNAQGLRAAVSDDRAGGPYHPQEYIVASGSAGFQEVGVLHARLEPIP